MRALEPRDRGFSPKTPPRGSRDANVPSLICRAPRRRRTPFATLEAVTELRKE